MNSASITFCPSCGESVERAEIFDAHAEGFRCQNGHYLHNLRSGVYTSETMGSYLNLTSGKESPKDILKEWLTNARLRDHLNDNLAGILRFLLDHENGKAETKEPLKYTYCPSCGEKLGDVTPEEELYETVLKCKNSHTFLSRGGMHAPGSEERFSFDYDERYFRMSYLSWMENKHLANYFPHELRKALNSYRNSPICDCLGEGKGRDEIK
ncbi:hypothetical protein KP004_20810 [Geomonas oryzisoli]|uniref:Uncharacterized protein n=1 Tax=Geomonas oryzisoli TaxID=2847992 RepID=A0ABX8JA34_9BACT|nr:hypothetical protein [Geomonas oryzisoli]QWV93567.1 hypothetical protein KP004_20810 [Geomonas oryzisoli]